MSQTRLRLPDSDSTLLNSMHDKHTTDRAQAHAKNGPLALHSFAEVLSEMHTSAFRCDPSWSHPHWHQQPHRLFFLLQGSPGGHPSSRRPTPSSSTGSSELRHARSWANTATAATAATATTTDTALNQPDRSTKVEDTSTSRGEQAEPSQQMSQQMSHVAPAAEAAVANGGTQSLRKPPPGFADPQSAAARPTRDRLQVKYEAWHPTAVASSGAPDPTAAASSPQLQQPQGLPAKPMPAGRPHRYRPDEAEVRPAAEQTEEEDQGAKRSRKGRSPHHPHTLVTPSPPGSAAEEEVQVSTLDQQYQALCSAGTNSMLYTPWDMTVHPSTYPTPQPPRPSNYPGKCCPHNR